LSYKENQKDWYLSIPNFLLKIKTMKRKTMTQKIRWGIVGIGGIAHNFANTLAILSDAELVAISSRTKESAEKFANEFNVPNRHVGVGAIAGEKDIDAVYIATPHLNHKDETISCLEGGKAVLCEKSFAMNTPEVIQMIDCAREKNLFLMEAMWMYFFPAMVKVREIIASGAIGEVRLVQAKFCFKCTREVRNTDVLTWSLEGGEHYLM